MKKSFIPAVLFGAVCASHSLGADLSRIRIEDRYLKNVPAFREAPEAKADDVMAIYYDGPEYQGKPSKVFAFYGCPKVKPGQKVPGIVLVHGGGGTAFAEWVRLWVANGYAAIALDTVGTVPVAGGVRKRIPDGGNPYGPDFNHLNDPFQDQWPYYVENAIARARTLLGSFPEVDDQRIGITGISWGGYLTCMAAGLDKRYLFAVHVYGCGFLKEKSAWMNELNEPGKERWSQWFDPSLYLPGTSMPVLWVCGTNDAAYPVESLIKSYALVKQAPVSLCVTIRMPHGHPEGWSPPEIKAFADRFCLGGTPLPTFSRQGQAKDGGAWAAYQSSTPIVKAELIFAKYSQADWKTRPWERIPAELHPGPGEVSATVPSGTQYYYFNINDSRNLVASSPITELPDLAWKPVEAATLTLSGAWRVKAAAKVARADGQRREVVSECQVTPPETIRMTDELCKELPQYNPAGGGWNNGTVLHGTGVCLHPRGLLMETLQVRSVDRAQPYRRGKDYEADADWATIGRLPGGEIKAGQPLKISYAYIPQRIDSIVLTPEGELALHPGKPHNATPLPPELGDGEIRLANIHVPGTQERLTDDNLFPILETPKGGMTALPIADTLLPKTMAKLRSGKPLHILAWGDSVTDGAYVKPEERWQARFVSRLKERFPQADICLSTNGWAGMTTQNFFDAPSGSPHNYQETVLGVKPDLIVLEFVNDAMCMNRQQWEAAYARILKDSRATGAEWIILTPHYVYPSWMGLTRQKEVDNDPRPYVAFLREFAAKNGVAVADAAACYGRLWRKGIPYNTLMTNGVNHPDERGMEIFADSLMALFP